ncbi:hypothetical protein LSTR_LSTR011221 [Laodelphax striatellus]|uniref:Uncharacterized protein n=1 Tax=Laodelphax striatellus TaxID=195883 RepID=A0A482XM84_LAOST|nr:hypothetical protein LSTR_LSTR011221 [Laodelphax striatellus]
MLVIWIGLLFGSSLQISSCDTNEISWSTQKTVPDLTSFEKKVNVSNNSIKNSGTRTEGVESFQVVEEGPKNVGNTSNENNVLVKRDTGRRGYSTLGGNQLRNSKQYQFETDGDRFRNVVGYEKDSGERIWQKDLENMRDGLENNGGGRLASYFAQFYQPAGRRFLGELGHKVTKLFGGGESPDYYEKPFGEPNIDSHFQRHEDNLNNALTFRDVVEGNKAAVRKDVSRAEGGLSRIIQEHGSSDDKNDYIDDSWLMSSMASDQSIEDDGLSSNIFDNGEDLAEAKHLREPFYNHGFNKRSLRQIEQTGKSDELLIGAQEMTEGLQRGETINSENIDSLLQGHGAINDENIDSIVHEFGDSIENSNPIPNTEENNLSGVEDTFEANILCPGGNNDGSSLLVNNNMKRDVGVVEKYGSGDAKSEIDRLKMDDSSLEDYKIGKILDSDQNVSLKSSKDLVTTSKVLSSNDENLNEKVVSGGNLDLESKPTNKHKRNGMHRLRNKMHNKIVDKQDVLPLKMDDSLHEQSPPISSIDNGEGILLKDLDLQDENKVPDTNEVKKTKPFSSQSSPNTDIRNKDKNWISDDQGFKLPLQDISVNNSIEVEADVPSFNSEGEAKLNQNSLGESIMESMDGVKTLKLSSVNFKADESNFSNDQFSSADKNPAKTQKLHYAATKHPIKFSHGNKHKKFNSTKGRIVSSYHRNGLLKHTTTGISPVSVLDSSDNLFNSKLFINKDIPSTRKQSSNIIKKGFKGREEKLDGLYTYDTTTKTKSVHKVKKNGNKHKSGISNTKMVKVKLSVSPCQFNKEKYLINNKSASKSSVPKILSSRSVKQDQKQLKTTMGGEKSNANTLKMSSEGKFDVTTQKMLKQEKLTKPSKGKKPANSLENPNFFDRFTTFPSTSTLQGTSNSTNLVSGPQKEINDVPSTTKKKSGLVPMKNHSARRKHEKSGHVADEKHESASLNEDNACDGDNADDDEYSDSCDKTTKSVCKTTKSECSATKSTEICDPLEHETKENKTEGPCEPEENEFESTKALCETCEKKPCEKAEAPCGTTQAPCVTTEDQCGTTQAPCETTEDQCGTTQAPCETTSETTEEPCETPETTEAPCGTTQAPCEATQAPCGTTQAPCETKEAPCEATQAPCETKEAPCGTTQAPCENTEDMCGTTQAPCETTEAPCGTTQAPCETTSETTEEPCKTTSETTEEPCETPEAPSGTTQAPFETTEAPCGTTQPPCETTEAPCENTEAPCGTTQPPCETTEAPCETTEDQSGTTEAPCETTCETTEEPCEMPEATEAPCGTTQGPCETTRALCQAIEPQCESTGASCKTTENQCTTTSCGGASPTPCETSKAECDDDEDDDEEEEFETDPPCQTPKVCKTASKKGNSTSEEKNEYFESNNDEDDDDDQYDYENE